MVGLRFVCGSRNRARETGANVCMLPILCFLLQSGSASCKTGVGGGRCFKGLGAFAQLQVQMRALLQQVLGVDDFGSLFSLRTCFSGVGRIGSTEGRKRHA